jgi:hypothetical protein
MSVALQFQCSQGLADITVNLLSTVPFEVNMRLFERCCRQSGQSAEQCERAVCLPSEGNTADLSEQTATARGESRAAAAEMGVPGIVQDSTTAGTPGTQAGTSQAGSSADQAGGPAGLSHSLQVDHSNSGEDTGGFTISSCSVLSQAAGSNGDSCGSSTTPATETYRKGPVLRPSIEELLTLVGGCLQRVLSDPAVMGAAQQPAAWMPDKASISASVAHHESRVQVSINEARSQGLLQQDMLRRLVR